MTRIADDPDSWITPLDVAERKKQVLAVITGKVEFLTAEEMRAQQALEPSPPVVIG